MFRCLKAISILTLVLAASAFGQTSINYSQNIITTIAGRDWVFPSQTGKAVNAPLSTVTAMAMDSAGQVYIADPQNNAIFRIDGSGNISTVAGNGIQGFSGEGGPATSASLSLPTGIAIDSAGNIYFTDQANQRVRRVGVDGNILTIAGTGTAGFSGDGGPANRSQINTPGGILVDPNGNIFFADSGNNRVREIDTNGNISTAAGDGTAATLSNPKDLALDSGNNYLYISDYGNSYIRKLAGGTLSVYAGRFAYPPGNAGDGGQASLAQLRSPWGLAIDASGNLIFSDSGNNTIRQITPSGVISTIAGGNSGQPFLDGAALQSSLFFPAGLLVYPGGKLYIADRGNQRIRVLSGGTVSTVAGNNQYRPPSADLKSTNTYLYGPQGIAIGNVAHDILIAESRGNTIRDVTNVTVANGIVAGLVALQAGQALVGGATANGKSGANTLLNNPYGVAKGADGTIYYADTANNVIRAISTSGVVTTVAGGGTAGCDAVAIPATMAGLNQPRAVLVDSSNNIFISDTGNNCIRVVDASGNINTYAGTGVAGYSGDGAAANAARISAPYGLAFPLNGNNMLYFADQGNHRIRSISPSRTISTVAGTGAGGVPSADGLTALNSVVSTPFGLALDAKGNIYYSENQYHIVRRIDTTGVVATIAGTNQVAGFVGDGGLAPDALLSYPAGIAIDPNNNYLYIADSGNDRIRAVIPIQPTFSIGSSNINLTASGGLTNNPDLLIPVQALLNGSQITGLAFTASPNVGSEWLNITPTSGTLPQQILVSANATKLSPGSTTGSFTIFAPGASPAAMVVNVAVAVGPTLLPSLAAVTPQISQSVTQGAAPISANIALANNGSGTINFSASVQTVTGGNWLSLPVNSGSFGNTAPYSLVVNTDPSSLAPGVYRGIVTVTGTSTLGPITPVTIPVALTVTAAVHVIQLTQTALNFRAITTGSSPLPLSFGIVNTGTGSMNWTATAVDSTGAPVPWISLSATSGTISAPNSAASPVSVAVTPLNMNAGDYYAKIQVASDASNSPQTVAVLMTVLPATTATFADIQPSTLVFTGASGTVPSSQVVNIAAVGKNGGAPISYIASAVTQDGKAWFADLPRTNTIQWNAPDRIVVQPNFTAQAPGTYTGSISLLLGDGSIRTIRILSVVTPSASPQLSRAFVPAAACSSSKLDLQFAPPLLTGSNSFTAYVGQQNTLSANVVYDCAGSAFTGQNGQVTAYFQDGEKSQSLTYNASTGKWSTTWSPPIGTKSTVAVQLTATGFSGANPVAGQSETYVASLSPGATVPLVAAGGVVSAASFQADVPIGVGGLISIFGDQLINGGGGQAASVPLPQTLSGTQVLLENQPVPLLYASNGQINVQVPYETNVNVPQHLVVQRGSAISGPFSVQVASVQPAVFLASSAGQGIIVNAANNVIAAPGTPVTAGNVIVIYCTGLGPTNPAVATGSAATQASYITTSGIAATIGGQPATLLYAGLTPGFPGLYQINAVVPAGVAGNAVPVIVTLAGQVSPTATMAIQ